MDKPGGFFFEASLDMSSEILREISEMHGGEIKLRSFRLLPSGVSVNDIGNPSKNVTVTIDFNVDFVRDKKNAG